MTRQAVHPLDAVHDRGCAHRQECVAAPLRPEPRRTYAVGTSNGGYQVRRAIETAPEFFDGGVDWEGTFVDPVAPNILSDAAARDPQLSRLRCLGLDSEQHRGEEHRRCGIPARHRQRRDFLFGPLLFDAVLGSDAVPMAKAARPELRHLRFGNRNLQLCRSPGGSLMSAPSRRDRDDRAISASR